jgi:hypothetical protein
VLLGIPKFRVYLLPQNRREFLEGFAYLLLPPIDQMHKAPYWRDDSHYTEKGALAYSLWLADQLVFLMSNSENN